MIRYPFVRRAIFGTYVILITFVLAHSINAFVSHSLSASKDTTLPLVLPHTVSPETHDAKALAESILVARLFPIPPGAGSLSDGREAISPPPPPLNVAKIVLLLGTAVNSSTGEFAIIEDLASKKQTLYHLLETVPAVGMIAQIEKDRVLFRQGSQEEWVHLAIGKLTPGFEYKITDSAKLAPPPAAPPLPLQVSSSTKRSVDRKILIDVANDTSLLYQQARPVSLVVNGQPQGVQLEVINHYSFYGELGFQSGDVLKRINGVDLRDPAMFVSVFQQLKDERTIQIDILRSGQPKTLAINVL